MNTLEQLKKYTTVVADSGDLAMIAKFCPQDATTNPSLITASAKQDATAALIDEVYAEINQLTRADNWLDALIDQLAVRIGVEISQLIPGRVSTEVDPRLSFDTAGTVAKAKEIIATYQHYGVPQQRVLIKIAATWQGIDAARQLELQGIHCNLTLLFGMHQAVACAEAGVQLISPFVGRITDWYKRQDAVQSYLPAQDPGVLSVRSIYNYYKQHGYNTEIMGASFRNIGQIQALAGCDLLTIAPTLLAELAASDAPLACALKPAQTSHEIANKPTPLNEASFAEQHAASAMASELLQQGIDGFIAARKELADWLLDRYAKR